MGQNRISSAMTASHVPMLGWVRVLVRTITLLQEGHDGMIVGARRKECWSMSSSELNARDLVVLVILFWLDGGGMVVTKVCVIGFAAGLTAC
jgi:hypothetical protein